MSTAAVFLTMFGPVFADKIADSMITNRRAWQQKLVDDLKRRATEAQPVLKLNDARSEALVRILKESEIWSEWMTGTDQNAIDVIERDLGDYDCGRPQVELRIEYTEIWAATSEAFGRHAPPELFGIIVLLSNLRKIEQTLDQLASGASDENARARRAAFHCLKAPYVPFDSDLPPAPSVLLSAHHAVVPFVGREDELASLVEWRDSAAQISLGLLWGEGGQGKTRLASELALRSAANWVAGRWSTADPDHLRSHIGDLAAIDAPVLAIVDYAEGQEDQLLALLNAAQDCGLRLRLLALARSGPMSDWFLNIEDRPGANDAAVFLSTARSWELDPLGAGLDALQYFNTVRSAFGTRDVDPAIALPGTQLLAAEDVENALCLAVAAYLDVFSGEIADSDTIATILGHEWRYLNRLIGDSSLLPAAKQLLALSTLCPSTTQTRAEALARHIGEIAGDAHLCSSLVRALKRLYPNEEGIGRLQPDLLGDRHVCDELPQTDGAGLWDGHWLTGLSSGPPELDTHEIEWIATNLSRCASSARLSTGAARRPPVFFEVPGTLAAAFLPFFGSLPPEWRAQLCAILTTISDEELAKTLSVLPRHSIGLASSKVELLRRLVDVRMHLVSNNEPEHLYRLAASLNNLGSALADTGQLDQALKYTGQSAAIFVHLAEVLPELVLGNLAGVMANLGLRYLESGNGAKALATAEAAVNVCRHVAATDRDRFQPDLAMCLRNLGVTQAGVGLWHEAYTSAKESVSIYRELVELDRDLYLADLAASLHNIASHQAHLDRREDARASAEEAVQIYRNLAHTSRDAHLADYAASLSNLAEMQSGLGLQGPATASAEESVGIYRLLADADPSSYLAALARASLTFSMVTTDRDRDAVVLSALDQAVSSYRRLADLFPTRFLPDLASALNNQGIRVFDIAGGSEALPKFEEASEIFRRLADIGSDLFRANLANSLCNLSGAMLAVGHRNAAVDMAREAVTIHEQLARTNPDFQLPSLAVSFGALSASLAHGKPLDAAKAALDGWRCVEDTPAARELAVQLANDHQQWCRSAGLEPDRKLSAWLAGHQQGGE